MFYMVGKQGGRLPACDEKMRVKPFSGRREGVKFYGPGL